MVFLLFFLTSTIAHADHLVDQEIIGEQQDCHLCNQGVDSPSDLPIVQATVVTGYASFSSSLTGTIVTRHLFVQPPLRAPPFIQ